MKAEDMMTKDMRMCGIKCDFSAAAPMMWMRDCAALSVVKQNDLFRQARSLSSPRKNLYPHLKLSSLLEAAWLALMPAVLAVNPPPDGGYPNNTTAEGTSALFSLSSGVADTALGYQALYHNTTSSYNTAEGFRALFSNTTGGLNTASGSSSLLSNTTGTCNVANGVNSLYYNTSGSNNTACGSRTLFENIEGDGNTAVGALALFHNAGDYNTALGFAAALTNNNGHYFVGFYNTAIGSEAFANGDGGSFNTALGASALSGTSIGGGSYNTALGFQALLHGNFGNSNIGIGALSGANVKTAEHVVCIDAAGEDVSYTTWIGNVFGVATQSGMTAPVVVSDSGQLGTVVSSKRFKKDIASMDNASEAILSLRPVTFHYKTDSKDTPQFGLIAEEVAKVNPALVLRDKDGKPFTVRYDQVNTMLLNEFLKEHKKVEDQQAAIADVRSTAVKQAAIIAQQQREIQALTVALKAQATRIEEVKDQLRAERSAPRVVADN